MGDAGKWSKWGYKGKASKIGWLLRCRGNPKKRGVKENSQTGSMALAFTKMEQGNR